MGNSSEYRAHGVRKITRHFLEKMRETETGNGIQVFGAFEKKESVLKGNGSEEQIFTISENLRIAFW